jgi:hypothetical protein
MGAEAFLASCAHPLLPQLLVLRDIVLCAEPLLVEHVKWNAPSYVWQGDDRLTFNLSRPDAISIVFHRGARAKDTKTGQRLLRDTPGFVIWATDQRASVRFSGAQDVADRAEWLGGMVRDWLAAVTPGS